MKKLIACVILCAAVLCVCALADDGLSDGTYMPDRFAFSGGTGRVTITCPEVRVENGVVTATIVFSSPNYTRLTSDGVEYVPVATDGGSVFEIPARLNRAFDVTATTTAMSQPHDIAYTLWIGLGGDDLGGLVWQSRLDLKYAECFAVDFYEGGYALISVDDGRRYLLTDEGAAVPDGLDPGIVVLKKPLDGIYIAATAVMSLMDRLDALDAVRFSGTQASGWTVENAASAMERGDILFAGRYSEPDYELLVREGCSLAIESTMILHTPKVQELLELLGIPVFIDRSSYEPHPLGRTEWIRLYGVMTGRSDEADAFFDVQAARIEAVGQMPPTGKTVGFFYVSADGRVVIRGADDYIARMIEMGGGAYAFSSIADPDAATSSVTLEDFYALALDCDYLIYSTSIDTTVLTTGDLLAKSPLMADLKAVREGHVFTAGNNLYQAADSASLFALDISLMLRGGSAGEMTFLSELKSEQ